VRRCWAGPIGQNPSRCFFSAAVEQFHAGGYTGDFNCEVSAMISKAASYDALKAAKQCYAAIAPAFDAAGVARGKRK
jgi:hypothetical protein